jgi:drug/metabolite transporter (DMT)-like permease
VKGLLTARLAVSITVVFWGISFVATKAALREVSPTTLIFVRFAIGVALLVAVQVARRGGSLVPRDAWPPLVLMGFVGIFIHQLLQSFGLTVTTATNTGWLIGLTPIWSALLSAVFLKERFGPMKCAGLLGGFLGALLVISKGRLNRDLLALPSTRGDLLIFLSTINWAVYSVLGLGTVKRLGPLRATTGMMVLGTLMLAPLFIWNQGWRELPSLTPTGWAAMLFLGIGCSGIGYLFWYGALEHLEVSRVAAFLYLEPFVTLVAAMVLLKEPAHPATLAGGLIVLASVYLLQRAPKEPAPSARPGAE